MFLPVKLKPEISAASLSRTAPVSTYHLASPDVAEFADQHKEKQRGGKGVSQMSRKRGERKTMAPLTPAKVNSVLSEVLQLGAHDGVVVVPPSVARYLPPHCPSLSVGFLLLRKSKKKSW